MNIFVPCEVSGRVRDALIRVGHNAVSCDLQESMAPGPHIKGDALAYLDDPFWDFVIAFPPCTDLAVSGARYFAEKRADGRQQKSIAFFMRFATCKAKYVAVENPVGIMSSYWRKPDQVIQPWMFGERESKATCLWLKNLPLLSPTNIIPLPKCGYWDNQTPSGQNKLGPSQDRAKIRGITYQGIADAMAVQWGLCL